MTYAAMLFLAASIPLVAADTITLRDGSRYYGTFVGSADGVITFDRENSGRQRFNIAQIERLEFDANRTVSQDRAPGGLLADRPVTTSPALEAGSVTIPAAAEIAVRTNEAIQGDAAASGRTYSANIDRDVMDSTGRVVIPRGSQALLVMQNLATGGVTSAPEVSLDLQSVTVGGNTYFVSTEDLRRASGREGIGKNQRTAEMVGGGAVLGTLLGAVAGGGRGAAIGAIAGAAAGAGAQVLTRGKTVNVPAETVLTFRLDQPLTLQRR